MAINHSWTNRNTNQREEEVTFVDITLWGRTAEVASGYLQKGRQVLIEGRLQLDQWDDKETGQRRSKLKVVGESMKMLGSGNGGGQSNQQQPADDGGFYDNPSNAEDDGFAEWDV